MIDSVLEPLLMALELLAANSIFGRLLVRRKFFSVRSVCSVIVCAEVVVLISFVYYKITGASFSYSGVGNGEGLGQSFFKFAYYLVIFAVTFACMIYCYENSAFIALLYCSGSYAAQHIAKNIANIFKLIPAVATAIRNAHWLSYIIDIAFCAAVFTAIYLLFVRRKVLPEGNVKGIKKKILVTLFVVFICIGLSRLTTDSGIRSTVVIVAETMYAVASCVLVLFILSNLTENDKMQNEVDMMTELLHRERERYKYEKENIELINIKCHDLKHQLGALKNSASEEYIRNIEEAVDIYDSAVKTGNDVLDVILAEKSLYCAKHHISITSVIHGEALSFMDNMDIYSLFGNAVSNAIEEVSKISDEKRRVISINVEKNGKFLSVHIENYCNGQIDFDGQFPQTKRDKNYHGFGMKSMNYIAKRYGGHMSVSAEDGMFRLNFIFPLPSQTVLDNAHGEKAVAN